MKQTTCLAILLALLLPATVWAREKNQRSVEIPDPVQVGATHLKPGNYTLAWDESGPSVHVKFMRDGKTVATVPATLKTDDQQIRQDDIVYQTSANQNKLSEIDFQHQKEALIFSQP